MPINLQSVAAKAFLALLLPLLSFADPNLWLLEEYEDQNISGWVMSEKLDGIRAYWDGKQLLTRNGKTIHAPKWFTQNYPPFAVDGELWSRRNDFENISSIVRDKTPGEGWKQIKHYIFEVPNAKGDLHVRLSKVKPYENSVITIIPQIPIENKAHLQAFLKEVEAKKGEGVVVRDPRQPYIAKRTSSALKVKTFHDAECKVMEHHPGKGKYHNMLGSFTCKLPSGITFKIGSGLSDTMRANPPKVGATVTFKHQGWTKYGNPRFPVFLRVRDDQ